MADALNIARTGLDISQQQIDVIAQNAANAKSLAYKQRMLVTTDAFYTTLKKAGLQDTTTGFSSPIPVQRGSGAKVAGITKIMTQGPKKDTGNPLDLYIDGGGYFAVTLPNNQIGYTRIGKWQLSGTRQIVSVDTGYPLADGIVIDQNIPLEQVKITNTGAVLDGQGNKINQISLYTFLNEEGLEEFGGGVAIETEASGAGIQANPGDNESVGKLVQKSLELSNVSQIEALTGLIEAQRAYELNLKIIAAQSDIMKATNETK